MIRTFIIEAICIVIVFVGGKYLKNDQPKTNELNDSSGIIENILDDEYNIIDEIKNEIFSEEVIESEETFENVVSESPEKQNTTIKQSEEKTKKQEEKNGNNNSSNIEKQESTGQKEVAQKKEEIKVIEQPKKEEKIVDEYVYNSAETQRLIADVNEIAKRNPDLWGANGEKLYTIEISSSITGTNYMSPYRKGMIEGIVLNVFPVKFLVYAQDHIKTGYTTETRYYIDIANY